MPTPPDHASSGNGAPSTDQTTAAPPFWSALWSEMRPWRGQLLRAAACSLVVGGAVAVQQNLVVAWLLDAVLSGSGADGQPLPPERRFALALGVVGIYAAMAVTRLLLWAWGWTSTIDAIEGLIGSLRCRLLRHSQALCLRFHDRMPSGELHTYVMGSPMGSLKECLLQFGMVIPYQTVAFAICLCFLVRFEPWLAAITLAVAAAIVVVNRRSQRVVRRTADDLMQSETATGRALVDLLRGARALKLLAGAQTLTDQVEARLEALRDQGATLARRQWIESAKPEAMQYLGTAMVYVAGAWFLVHERITPGQFVAFATSFSLLMAPIANLMQLNLVRAKAEAGLSRIASILAVESTTSEPPPAERTTVAQRAAAVTKAEAGIAIEGLVFGYDPERPVLHGIDLRIPDGQSVALVGTSGSGKSTFASLLLRLYDPQRGRILLDGADLRRYGLDDLRASFGVVPQEPFLFQATLRDNLRAAQPQATDAKLSEALSLAGAAEVVAGLPLGLDTLLGEGGVALSGGQRQRLAIARAILARPRRFIFDEATSALDNVSEAMVRRALTTLARDRTTIIIAHRLATVRDVDRILVFADGRIVQDGGYEQLAATPGRFRELLDPEHAATPR